ncbi:MAG TPA: copper resistance protein CopC [Candidatus Limnocylindrales bacterium]|nr:copper resistance protein CopC [Candidatus Limnocylindrales bacterium]
MARAFRPLGAAVVTLGLFLALAVAHPGMVAAHALLRSSSPTANSSLAGPPQEVSLTFTEPPDPRLSTVEVLDSSGKVQAGNVGTAKTAPGQPATLQLDLPDLPNGVYTITWRTVSSVDGHLAAGSFAFSVGVPAPAGGTESQSSAAGEVSAPWSETVARFILLAGLIGLVGGAFVGGLLAAEPPRGAVRLVLLAWIAAAVGTVLLAATQAQAAGISFGEVAGSSLGQAFAARAAPLAIGAVAVEIARRLHARGRRQLVVAGLAGLGAMLADVLFSHAAAGPLPAVNVAIQWLHVAAVGVWIGGVAGLVASVLGARRGTDRAAGGADLARRFAAVAGIGLGLVAASGAVRAFVEIGTLERLLTTDFGHLVLVKAGLLVGLAVLGALNHFRHVPRGEHGLGPLRLTASGELVLGVVALLATALLVNASPPAEAAGAAGPASLRVSGSDFGTSVRVRLTVQPGTVGANRFETDVTDYDSGQPVDASGVDLRFSLPERPSVGSSELQLSDAGPGTFSGQGANLSMPGSWSVAVRVANGLASVEVPLTVHVAAPPQQVDVLRTPGQPTIYTVHVGGGPTAQVYLDPDRPNVRNDVHVTWFDAAGNGLAVRDITIAAAASGASSTRLPVQTLAPGHVAGSLAIGNGPETFIIEGTSPDGTALRAELTIRPGT